MAKQALIICAGGMSSSMIAKKTMTYLQEKGEDIEMDAVGVPEGQKRIEADKYDLYLVSPQNKMNFKQLKMKKQSTNLSKKLLFYKQQNKDMKVINNQFKLE